MAYSLRDTDVVITGAASGIGRALALKAASQGARLILVDRDEAGLEAVAAVVRGRTSAAIYAVDLADPEATDMAARRILSGHGKISMLINNAGVAITGSFEDMGLQDFEWLMRINFGAMFQLTKLFLPELMARPEARLVNISSVFGLIAPPWQAAYSSSKFAVRGFSEALRNEFERTNLRVSCVFPGGIQTAIARNSRIVHADKDHAAKLISDFEATARTAPERAAEIIIKGVLAGRPEIYVGADARLIARLKWLFPIAYWRMLRHLMARSDPSRRKEGAQPD